MTIWAISAPVCIHWAKEGIRDSQRFSGAPVIITLPLQSQLYCQLLSSLTIYTKGWKPFRSAMPRFNLFTSIYRSMCQGEGRGSGRLGQAGYCDHIVTMGSDANPVTHSSLCEEFSPTCGSWKAVLLFPFLAFFFCTIWKKRFFS